MFQSSSQCINGIWEAVGHSAGAAVCYVTLKAYVWALGLKHLLSAWEASMWESKARYWTHADRAFSTLWKQFPCTPDGSLASEQLVYHIPEISADGPP